jgi:uncharacterized protein (TIGR03437 family)
VLASIAAIVSNFARNYGKNPGAFRYKPCGYSPRWRLVAAALLLIASLPAIAQEPYWMMSANGVVQDGQGNVYVVGAVDSDIVPVTTGAFQTKFNAATCGSYQNGFFGTPQPIPCPHGFAVKISADGSEVLYGTYLEGSLDDNATPVGVDSSGDLFILVNSTSPNFPSTGSMAGFPPDDFGANYFILELSSDGSRLLFSDEFGFPGFQDASTVNATLLTSDRKLIFGGTTDGTAFPTTPGAYLSARPNASLDGFVFEWDPKTNMVVHSTLIGGSNQDLLTQLTMDASGNFYVAGYTVSTDFPLTPGAFYSPGTDSQGLLDFVAKLDANLSTLDFSLLFGGSYHPIPNAVAVDSSGNVYIDGWGSEDLPVTPGAFETSYSGGFLAKFNGQNGARIYFTYLGDGDSGFPGSLAPASDGTVWAAGGSQWGGVVITPDALEPNPSSVGPGAGYLKHISSDGSQQLYGTYLGEVLALVSPGVALATGSTNLFQIDDFNVPSQPPTGPLITSIVNAASLSQPDYISPGEIVSIFGLSIGPTQPVSYQLNSSGTVPSNLNGLQVLINVVAAPILYASENQINAVVPFSVMNTPANIDTATFEVQNPATAEDLSASTLWIVSSVPGVFESGGTGLILNQDATQNTAANPAKQGTIISLFVTGVGPMTPSPLDGSFAIGTTSTPTLPIQVFLGTGSGLYTPMNQNSIAYAGDAPGEIEGLQQINVQLPTGTVYSSLYITAGYGVSNAVAFFEQ